jgi:hypothetical protein
VGDGKEISADPKTRRTERRQKEKVRLPPARVVEKNESLT